MHFVGLAGMPRRIPDYSTQFADFNSIASIGAFGFGLSQLLFAWIVWQCCVQKKGVEASQEVWESPKGLEWTVPSPAPYHTFDTPPRVSGEVSFSHDG
jgi:cytochrome c oxidase subunit 1